MSNKQPASVHEFNKNEVHQQVQKVINSGFKVVTDNSEIDQLLVEGQFNWDELEQLRQEIGMHLIEFTQNVGQVIGNKEIVANIDHDDLDDYQAAITLFFDDIDRFSRDVQKLIAEHNGKTGPVKNIDEYDAYNRLSIQYHTLIQELLSSIATTVSEIFLITDAAVRQIESKKAQAQPVTIDQDASLAVEKGSEHVTKH